MNEGAPQQRQETKGSQEDMVKMKAQLEEILSQPDYIQMLKEKLGLGDKTPEQTQ